MATLKPLEQLVNHHGKEEGSMVARMVASDSSQELVSYQSRQPACKSVSQLTG